MASSIFGNNGGNSVLDQAIWQLGNMGATASTGDAMMRMLYKSNPQVRPLFII